MKPGESSPRQNGNSMNSSSHMGPQSSNAGAQESGDFSFVVLERSPPESNSGNFGNGMPSVNGSSMMPPSFATGMPSIEVRL